MDDLLQQILFKLERIGQKVDLLELGQLSLTRKLDVIFSQVAELTEFRSSEIEDLSALSAEVERLKADFLSQSALLEKLSSTAS